jgi:hypothetical protein
MSTFTGNAMKFWKSTVANKSEVPRFESTILRLQYMVTFIITMGSGATLTLKTLGGGESPLVCGQHPAVVFQQGYFEQHCLRNGKFFIPGTAQETDMTFYQDMLPFLLLQVSDQHNPTLHLFQMLYI